MKILFLLALLLGSNSVSAKKEMHTDVRDFVKNADQCDQAAGEWDSRLSKKRQNEIERSLSKYCGTAKKQLDVLMKKYEKDAAIRALIDKHAYDPVKYFYEQ